jgi:hypothetical protein
MATITADNWRGRRIAKRVGLARECNALAVRHMQAGLTDAAEGYFDQAARLMVLARDIRTAHLEA